MARTKKLPQGSRVVYTSKDGQFAEYNGKVGKVVYWGNFHDESGQAHGIEFRTNKNEFGVETIWAFPSELSDAK